MVNGQSMLGWIRGWSARRRTGQQLYERIVAQARAPSLFDRCGVPDTMDGRLEMLLLHTVLGLDRLRAEGADGQRLGQRLIERLIADVDDALRRIGLGDDSVAPRIKRLAGALAERSRDYGLAFHLASGDGNPEASRPMPPLDRARPLEAALREHVYGLAALSDTAITEAQLLADYVRRTRSQLSNLAREHVLSGRITFPPVIEVRGENVEVAP